MKKLLSILLISIIFLPSTLLAGSVFDESKDALKQTSETAQLGDPNVQQANLSSAVGDFINSAVGFLGVLAVILVVYAGGLWMTAAGNDEKVKKAKQIIKSVAIGVVIVGFAYGITAFIISQLVPEATDDSAERAAQQIIDDGDEVSNSVLENADSTPVPTRVR